MEKLKRRVKPGQWAHHLPETSQEVNEKMEEIIFFIQQLMPNQSQ